MTLFSFANKIKVQREKYGLSQRELARLIPTNPSTLCKIENCKQEPSFFILQRLIIILNIDFNEIIKASNEAKQFFFD